MASEKEWSEEKSKVADELGGRLDLVLAGLVLVPLFRTPKKVEEPELEQGRYPSKLRLVVS
jgi:hypothetical protein